MTLPCIALDRRPRQPKLAPLPVRQVEASDHLPGGTVGAALGGKVDLTSTFEPYGQMTKKMTSGTKTTKAKTTVAKSKAASANWARSKRS